MRVKNELIFLITMLHLIHLQSIQVLSNAVKIVSKDCVMVFDYIYLNVSFELINSSDDSFVDAAYIEYNLYGDSSWTHSQNCNISKLAMSHSWVRCRLFPFEDANIYWLRLIWIKNQMINSTMLSYYYAPSSEGFKCTKDHNVKDLKIHSKQKSSITLAWGYSYYDKNYIASARLQLIQNGSLITEVTCTNVPLCTMVNLTACSSYELCVVTEFNVASNSQNCINASTEVSTPLPPTELKVICDTNSANNLATLSWQGTLETEASDSFFKYELDVNDNHIQETTVNKSISFVSTSNVIASVRSCSKCGCSIVNKVEADDCKKTSTESRTVLITVIGIVIILVPFMMFLSLWYYSKRYQHNDMHNNISEEKDLNIEPRTSNSHMFEDLPLSYQDVIVSSEFIDD